MATLENMPLVLKSTNTNNWIFYDLTLFAGVDAHNNDDNNNNNNNDNNKHNDDNKNDNNNNKSTTNLP
jgi:hypothetical protein